MNDSTHQTDPDFTEALNEYREYYVIRDFLDINVIALDSTQALPGEEEFIHQIPHVFRLASDMLVIDQQTMQSLRSLGENAAVIADLFKQQNHKLNVLLGYLLRHEDDPQYRQQAFEYGGAGVGFRTSAPLSRGQLVELKLFIPEQSVAIYSIGEIIDVQPTDNGYETRALFRRISDADRDQLIKATLHAQSRLLKQRASQRKE